MVGEHHQQGIVQQVAFFQTLDELAKERIDVGGVAPVDRNGLAPVRKVIPPLVSQTAVVASLQESGLTRTRIPVLRFGDVIGVVEVVIGLGDHQGRMGALQADHQEKGLVGVPQAEHLEAVAQDPAVVLLVGGDIQNSGSRHRHSRVVGGTERGAALIVVKDKAVGDSLPAAPLGVGTVPVVAGADPIEPALNVAGPQMPFAGVKALVPPPGANSGRSAAG